MRVRPRHSFRSAARLLRATLVAAGLVTGASSSARAAGDDPFSGDAPPAEAPSKAAPAPSQQAPASAPSPSSDASPSGIVERLPSSAYPEPVTRGLYGGSLWSTFHGLQWPFYPRTGIGISGYAWLDNDFERVVIGDPVQHNVKEVLQQGRVLLRVTPTYTKESWFLQAQAELVANKDQTQAQPALGDTDDLWVRTGQWNRWDVTVGRFEAFELYHLGMGLDLNTEERRGAYDASATPPDLYGASFLFYRPGGPGNIALHLYPLPYLRAELLAQVGNDGGLNSVGGRPALVFDIGWLKLKGGGEYQWETSRSAGDKTEKRNRGGAGSAQIILEPYVEFGANFGYAIVDVFDNVGTPDQGHSYTKYSFGGFANIRVMPDALLGLGVNDVRVTDTHQDDTGRFGHFTHLQAFAALQYLVLKQLYIKVVGAYAKADFEPSFTSQVPHGNTMYSARVRLMYLF
jgi:hypothetical protein